MVEFLLSPAGLITLIGLLIMVLIFWYQYEENVKNKEEQKRMEEKLEKMGAYLDGLPQLPKKHPIRKGFDEGILAMDKYKWDEAIDIFRKLLPDAEDSQKVSLLNVIGLCFYLQDNLGEALGSYQESLELAEKIQDEKGIVANLNNIGLVYAEKGDYDTAIRDFNKAIELDPKLAQAFYNRGLAYVNKKDYALAIRDFTRAIELDPSFAMAFCNRGTAYADNGGYDTAIRDYTKAIELDSNYADAFYNRGIVYCNKKDYDTAIRDYTRAIELDPNHAEAMANIGSAYKGKGDKKNARIWWKKALKRQEYLRDGAGESIKQCIKELEE